MDRPFDPYHKWLGIPPHQQPPSHYRLLGLEAFESDLDVIEAAAARQIAHVQTYKIGPQSELTQRLLNEIAQARQCLLTPARKEEYDRSLRRTLWYYKVDEKVFGPLDDQRLESAVKSGAVNRNTRVRLGDEGPWGSASSVRGLFGAADP